MQSARSSVKTHTRRDATAHRYCARTRQSANNAMRLNHTTVAQRRARHAQRVLTKNRCPMGNHPLQPQMRNPTRQTAYTEAEGAQYSGVKTHTIQHKLQYHTHNAIKASNMHRNRIDRTVIAPSAWRQSTASSPSSACQIGRASCRERV